MKTAEIRAQRTVEIGNSHVMTNGKLRCSGHMESKHN